MKTMVQGLTLWVATLGGLALASAAMGHGSTHAQAEKAGAKQEETKFGRAGDPAKVGRTIDIGMDDSMHFTPGDFAVRRGATIRFKVRNSGTQMHEMVIGTMKELKDHAELMKRFPGMEHDEPYMAHVPPGKERTMVWQFTKAGRFRYACLIPGHMEAGMIGHITVK